MIHTGEFTVTELFEMAVRSSAVAEDITRSMGLLAPVTCNRITVTLEELDALEAQADQRYRRLVALENERHAAQDEVGARGSGDQGSCTACLRTGMSSATP